MFSLMLGLWHYIFDKVEVQILIIGLDNAGKTTILEQCKGIWGKTAPIDPSKIPPTIGMNIGKMVISNCQAVIWDLGGQKSMRSIWKQYFNEAHGVIFVVDAADSARFPEAKAALDGMLADRDVEDAPVLVLGNKNDLETAVEPSMLEDVLSLNMIQDRPCRLFSVSAIKSAGIEEGVSWLMDVVKSSTRLNREQ